MTFTFYTDYKNILIKEGENITVLVYFLKFIARVDTTKTDTIISGRTKKVDVIMLSRIKDVDARVIITKQDAIMAHILILTVTKEDHPE